MIEDDKYYDDYENNDVDRHYEHLEYVIRLIPNHAAILDSMYKEEIEQLDQKLILTRNFYQKEHDRLIKEQAAALSQAADYAYCTIMAGSARALRELNLEVNCKFGDLSKLRTEYEQAKIQSTRVYLDKVLNEYIEREK